MNKQLEQMSSIIPFKAKKTPTHKLPEQEKSIYLVENINGFHYKHVLIEQLFKQLLTDILPIPLQHAKHHLITAKAKLSTWNLFIK